ncbi:Tuftelin-interacting protein 11 [Strongyloides ratti]|uniref:Tuftelin-interacting protein 11 n=1 Tax=Strongyloides ratti TaxID=34506 RepID=A0A090KY87_STRRB|nr:Tuftelin-interacting protein 11 [Strongyloides ratti]CEF62485.1 Tuftelin-interacting protein 11 [Strongyloides ratti]
MSESEEEAIDFDINSMDYEDAIDGMNRKRRYNMTKEDHIYDEKKKLSKPINFVSGGTTKDTDEKITEEKKDIKNIKTNTKKSFSNEFAGMRNSATSNITKGSVIMNIMKKMGYDETKGLGKDKQGTIDTIEVNVRPGRGALGSYDFENKNTIEKSKNKNETQKNEKNEESRKNKNKKKEVVKYEDYYDITKVDATKNLSDTSMKIIDMTGKNTRVFDSMHSLLSTKCYGFDELDEKYSKYNIPEVTQNLNMLCSMAEFEIEKSGKEYVEKKILINKYKNDFNEIQDENIPENKVQENSSNPKNSFLMWKAFLKSIDNRELEPQNYKMYKKISDLPIYDRIVYESLHVPIRRSILSWKPKEECDVLKTFFMEYDDVIPHWFKEYIKIRFIVPKIESEIESWDPITDRLPLHKWFIPIHEVMPKHLKHVHYMIRNKIAKGLQLWEGKDLSPLRFLKIWKNIFSQKSFTDFIKKNIFPKLHGYLANISFTLEFDFSDLKRFFQWESIISRNDMLNLFVNSFFPGCSYFISTQLNTDKEGFKSIALFYIRIRNILPANFLFSPEIMNEMANILIIIKKAAIKNKYISTI